MNDEQMSASILQDDQDINAQNNKHQTYLGSSYLLKKKAEKMLKRSPTANQEEQLLNTIKNINLTINDFEFKKKLGQGAYGKVFMANFEGEVFAIKKLSKDHLLKTNKVNSVFRERDILIQNKTCRFLPKIYHTFMDEEYLYIVLEYVPNGMLSEKLNLFENGLPKHIVKFYAAQLVLTIEYLNSQNIAHRDIKPGNIMLDENYNMKLIDFGEAKVIDKYDDMDEANSMFSKPSVLNKNELVSQSSFGESYFSRYMHLNNNRKNKVNQPHRGTFCGTPQYCAPEMLENNSAGLFTDLWALGVIIYELSVGKKMFTAKNNMEIFDKIIKHDVYYPEGMEQDTIDLIKALVVSNPYQRLGLRNFSHLKNHKFFEGIDWNLYNKQQVPSQLKDLMDFQLSQITKQEEFKLMNGVGDPLTIIDELNETYSSTRNTRMTIPLQIQMNGSIKESNVDYRLESEILVIQDEWKQKVIKHGTLGIRHGILFKSFKQYQAYMLESGVILFFNPETHKENLAIRMFLDDTVSISNQERATIKSKQGRVTKVNRFNLRVGNVNYRIESISEENWVDTIANFDFTK